MGTKVKTRQPKVRTRPQARRTRGTVPNIPTLPDPPEKKKRNPRRYIPASAPTVCPDCGHNTRMTDGRHVDPVRQTILEYRDCVKCSAKLAAGRPMTQREKETLCDRAQAIGEYNDAKG